MRKHKEQIYQLLKMVGLFFSVLICLLLAIYFVLSVKVTWMTIAYRPNESVGLVLAQNILGESELYFVNENERILVTKISGLDREEKIVEISWLAEPGKYKVIVLRDHGKRTEVIEAP